MSEDQHEIETIAAKLRTISLFSPLSDQELQEIAAKGERQLFERGDVIIEQGQAGEIFCVILVGQAREWCAQNGGRRLLNYHTVGDFFGEKALLGTEPCPSTVDVVDDIEVVVFGKDGFDLIIQNVEIADYLRAWGEERSRRSDRAFEGKDWDEITIILAHRSWVALARMILAPILIMVLTIVVWVVLSRFAQVSTELILSLSMAIAVGMGLWIFWMWEDWRNDDLIVTSKRIVHIERTLVPPFPTERREILIHQVQETVTHSYGLLTLLFGVQALEIKTIAGTIWFTYLENAGTIREEIFDASKLAQTRRFVNERTRIRQKLLQELGRPVKEVMPLESRDLLTPTPKRTGLLGLFDYFNPRTQIVESDRIIWRKHWLILWKATLVPFLLFLCSWPLLVLAFLRPSVLDQVPFYVTIPLAFVFAIVSFGWYLWNYDGWTRDIYIVTDEQIVDIEGTPFNLRGERRTDATFDRIQNTYYESPNFLAKIFAIGDVTADTAQEEAFTFHSVSHPARVQQEIFRRLTNFREKRAYQERAQRDAEFTSWFGTYHRTVIEPEEQVG